MVQMVQKKGRSLKQVKNKRLAKLANRKKQKVGRIITKDILIGDLISKYPEASEILMKHGFHCIGCMISPYETLEAGSAVHGIPLPPLLEELNSITKKSKG